MSINSFPPAGPGEKRFVIELKPLSNEKAFRVELIPGRVAKLDHANRHHLGGKLKQETLEGYGYSYYRANLSDAIASTLMWQEGDVPSDQFVAAESKTVPYNSRVPLVVYAPENAEVHYRIWTLGGKDEKKELVAKEG